MVRRFLIGMIVAAFAVLLAIIAGDRWMVISGGWRTYDTVADAPLAQAILVPGARVVGSTVSAILEQRLAAAIELYDAGKSPVILLSGDYSSKYYDESSAMSQYVVRHGIPAEAVVLDHAGYSTYDSMYRAKNTFGYHSVIIVSQDFHLPRALFIARHLGLDAIGFNATRVPLSHNQAVRQAWREPLARIKAVYEVFTGAMPSFTGSGLPIDGAGNVIRD